MWENVCSLQIRHQGQNEEMTPPKEANDPSMSFRSKTASMAVVAYKGPPQPQRWLKRATPYKGPHPTHRQFQGLLSSATVCCLYNFKKGPCDPCNFLRFLSSANFMILLPPEGSFLFEGNSNIAPSSKKETDRLDLQLSFLTLWISFFSFLK